MKQKKMMKLFFKIANAWAPLQHWISEGLRTLDDKDATKLANKWTQRWTLSNYIAYKETKVMFEKVAVFLYFTYIQNLCDFWPIQNKMFNSHI